MAVYDNLPVYKASYDLMLELFATVKNMEKEYKYTLGERLKNEIIDLIIGIYKANSSHEKREYLKKSREGLEVVRLLIRASYDLKQINLKRMVYLNEAIENISKQLAGWQKANIPHS